MHIKTYRDFEIFGTPRRQFVAEMDGVEFVGNDLYDVETAIDRFYEDQWREHVAEVGEALEKLDATLDSLDAHGASWAGGRAA